MAIRYFKESDRANLLKQGYVSANKISAQKTMYLKSPTGQLYRIAPSSGTTAASRASVNKAAGLPAGGVEVPVGYTQAEADAAFKAGTPLTAPRVSEAQVSALKAAGEEIPQYAQDAIAKGNIIKELPGLGTLTTIPKNPEPVAAAPTDQNLPGLYARTGITPTPQLTYTPPQATNANNTVYKDANGAVFEVGTNRPITLEEFKSRGLNIQHVNYLKNIQQGGAAGGTTGVPAFGSDSVGTTPVGTITNAYASFQKQLDDISKALLASKTPTSEELDLQRKLVEAKNALSKFDTETLSRAEAYSGRGRGETLGEVSGNVTKDARTRALQRLGMAQDTSNLVDMLSLTQAQREQQGAIAQAQYDIAAKRLDVALGISKEMQNIADSQKDDARKFLLDVVDFADGLEYDQLDPATKAAIQEAVANSPLTLGMVKNALHQSILDDQKKASEKANTDEEREIAAFKRDLSDWDMKGSREQFITRLEFLHPDIKQSDITAAVYKYYPDGYEKTTPQKALPPLTVEVLNALYGDGKKPKGDIYDAIWDALEPYKDAGWSREKLEEQYRRDNNL